MIVKELDEFSSESKLVRAGQVAEEQMAYYLRRAFKDDKDIFVFNHLRLEQEQDTAQMDHLILHQHGIFIVESKSVTTKIQVNDSGEWIRWFNSKPQGIPSPVLQAQRQGEFLRKYLNAHAEVLLSKILGLRQATFRNMPLDILVAISDSGIINRPKKTLLEEVCKADQVTERIRAKIEKSRKANNLFSLDLTVSSYSFTQEELSKIVKFLLDRHKPLALKHSARTISEPQTKIAKLQSIDTPVQPGKDTICRHCKNSNLTVEYGKYSYYFKCLSCSGNTAINSVCKTCGSKERIRKSGRQFYAECESCATSNLFYTNPAPKR